MKKIFQVVLTLLLIVMASKCIAQDSPLNVEINQDTFVVQYEMRYGQPARDSATGLFFRTQIQVPVDTTFGTGIYPYIWYQGKKLFIRQLAVFEPRPKTKQ